MSRKSRVSAEELATRKEKYGEVLSFRLKRTKPDQAQVLDEFENLSKDEKVDLFVQAVLTYLGKPIYEDNAATTGQLRQMVNEVIKALSEANQLISKLRQGGFKVDDGDNSAINKLSKLPEEFIGKMNAQQRATKTLRPPSDSEEE